MRRLAPFLLAAAVLAAIVLRDRWVPLLPGFGAAPAYLGYVEGETVLVASPVAGRLVARPVMRGQPVAKGAPLFTIDPAAAQAALAQAEAALAQAHAQLADLRTGRRPQEQDVTRAQLAEAEAAARYAAQDLERKAALVPSSAASRAQLDQARSTADQARARVAELRAQLAVGDLAARAQQIAAAEANVAAQRAAVAQAQVKLADLSPVAPDAAEVDDTFFDPGEYVPAGTPVVALLPPGNVKLRFFVPEADVARARIGARIPYRCDGCSPGRTATITYVAPQAEYTPPVIYSEAARQKLVFMVEARPDGGSDALHPGLPVDVEPLK